jgi:alpha-methylacyl-CoA racemase
MSKPLAGKTVIDLSHRLPGPLAGKLLAGLGANVIKIEDERFKDPFIQGLFAEMDNSFPVWYKHLNAQKDIQRFNFSDEADQKKIQELIKNSDAVIMAIPEKVQTKLGVTPKDLEELNKPLAVVYPLASKDGLQNMHDLNALALTGLLALHARTHHTQDMAPPFLPIAGINFGQKMAFDLLGALVKAVETNSVVTIESYLYESTQEVFSSFWPEELRGHTLFLHNGLYPCYNLYQTKDGRHIAMACVEEKFWASFCELFKLSYTMDERFQTSGEIHKELVSLFASMTAEDVERTLNNHDICINIL